MLKKWAARRGRRPKVVPTHLEAFYFILRTGSPWREVPSKFGAWSTIYSQFRRWCLCGLWDALLAWLAQQAKGTLRHVDGSYSSTSTGCKAANRPARHKPSGFHAEA